MKSIQVVLVLVLTALLPATPSNASPECDLFLFSGVAIYYDDPAFVACWSGLGEQGLDTSVLTPGAFGGVGYVRGEASWSPPTDASITAKDVDGRESRTPVTFRWFSNSNGLRGWLTNEYVSFGPRAMSVVIVARFGGRLHRHEYGRVLPPASGGPSRSGTVAVGVPPGTVDPVLGPPACEASPECRVWLASGCVPRLGGRDPAMTSSIVDVRGLAGSTRRAVLAWPHGAGLASTWEFWTSDCRRIGGPRTASAFQWFLTIPRNAHWMTVTAPIGPYRWQLW